MIGLWLGWMPLLVAMVAVVILPGLPWALLTVRSRTVAVAVASTFTFGTIPLLALAWDALGIPWMPSTVFPFHVAIFISGLVFLLRRHRRSRRGSGVDLHRPAAPRQALVLALAAAAGWLLAATPMLMNANPADPAQQWDSTFHLNGVWSMIQIHEASPIGALRELYGGRSVFYPNSWHALVALFSTTTTVIQAANVSSLMLMAVWVLGAAGLMRSLTTDRSIVIAGTVMSGGLLAMPADALTMYNQWPHATGAALVPGTLAIAIEFARRCTHAFPTVWATGRPGADPASGLLTLIAPTVLFLLGVIGAAGGHPSAVFSVIAVLIPPVLAAGVRLAVRAARNGSMLAALLWLAFALAPLLVFLGALHLDKIKAMGRYPRSGLGWDYAFSRAITPFPPFTWTLGMSMTVFLMGLLTAGGIGVLVWQRSLMGSERRAAQARPEGANLVDEERAEPACRSERPLVPGWVIASFFVMAFFTFLAYGPNSELRTFLLAPWYLDPRRIMAVHGLFQVVLAAVGLVVWVRLIIAWSLPRSGEPLGSGPAEVAAMRRRWPLVELGAGVLVACLSLLAAFDARLIAVDYVYDAAHLGKPGMATPGELAMLRRMPDTLPEDALVLGDPIAGAAYTEVIGQRQAFFPQLTLANADAVTEKILADGFNRIHTDAQICEIVRREGITHFYEDADGLYYNFMRSQRHPGLYDVDTSRGFELVDEGDSARLWKITACD